MPGIPDIACKRRTPPLYDPLHTHSTGFGVTFGALR